MSLLDTVSFAARSRLRLAIRSNRFAPGFVRIVDGGRGSDRYGAMGSRRCCAPWYS